MKYLVKADSITGLKGAKYRKGAEVTEDCFAVGHAKKLEESGALKALSSDKKKKTD